MRILADDGTMDALPGHGREVIGANRFETKASIVEQNRQIAVLV